MGKQDMHWHTQYDYQQLFSKGCGWYFRLVAWYWGMLGDYIEYRNWAIFIFLFPPVFAIAMYAHILLGAITLLIALVLSLYVIFSWPFVLLYYKNY